MIRPTDMPLERCPQVQVREGEESDDLFDFMPRHVSTREDILKLVDTWAGPFRISTRKVAAPARQGGRTWVVPERNGNDDIQTH